MKEVIANMKDENAMVEGMVDSSLKYILEHLNEDGSKIAFQVPDTRNFALLSFKADRGDDYWMFTVSCFRAGTDMLFSHFLSSGSKEEVVAYMKDENERKTIADSVNELSKKVDSKY